MSSKTGTNVGSISQDLVNQIDKLSEQNQKCYEASLTGVGRVWMSGSWEGDMSDVSGMKSAFNREHTNSLFSKALDIDDPGTKASSMVLRFQNDYMAAMDRAFRTRHANSIRAELFAANRRKNAAKYVLRESSIEYANEKLARGQ